MTRLVNAADLEIANHAFRALLTSHADLLAALKGLMAHAGEHGWWLESHAVGVMDAAKAAIARAEAPAR